MTTLGNGVELNPIMNRAISPDITPEVIGPGIFGPAPLTTEQLNNQQVAGQNIALLTHPLYDFMILDWRKWRLTYASDDHFVEEYLVHFSEVESAADFENRKKVTCIPAFAKSAVEEIKDAIANRLGDVSRKDGPLSYQSAIEGRNGGVDLRGGKLNWFIATKVLPELLVMRKVGVFVDNFQLNPNESILSKANKHPYFYTYAAEDIRSWSYATYEDATVLQSVLLRDHSYIIDEMTGLPMGEVERFRLLWINEEDGKVHVRFYNLAGNQIDYFGAPGNEDTVLNISQIPFHIFEISESLLRTVANHQISLLNLESSDISFLLRGNIPFYIEEYNPSDNSAYLKAAQSSYGKWVTPTNPDGTPVVPGQPGWVTDADGITHATSAAGIPNVDTADQVETGPTRGRRYPKGTNPPAFIAPTSDGIKVSIEKQKQLKEDIKELIHLAVSDTRAASAPAAAREMDQQGFESGLTSIGFELEHGEQCLAYIWSLYDGEDFVADVHYPTQYALLTPEQNKSKIDQSLALRDQVSSLLFKKEMSKEIVRLVLGAKVSSDLLTEINKEIDDAPFYTSEAKTIQGDAEAGLVSVDTASLARGWPKGEADAAKADHAERLARIQEAQVGNAVRRTALQSESDLLKTEAGTATPAQTQVAQIDNPAARGLPDLAGSPSAAKNEKIGKPGRGQAK